MRLPIQWAMSASFRRSAAPVFCGCRDPMPRGCNGPPRPRSTAASSCRSGFSWLRRSGGPAVSRCLASALSCSRILPERESAGAQERHLPGPFRHRFLGAAKLRSDAPPDRRNAVAGDRDSHVAMEHVTAATTGSWTSGPGFWLSCVPAVRWCAELWVRWSTREMERSSVGTSDHRSLGTMGRWFFGLTGPCCPGIMISRSLGPVFRRSQGASRRGSSGSADP